MSRNIIKFWVYDPGEGYVIEMGEHIHKYASLELLLRDIKLLFNNRSEDKKNVQTITNKEDV